MRILLAEDDPHDAELTLRGLKFASLESDVVHVTNGEEALDYMLKRGNFSERDSGNPSVILLDLKMPMIDGLEVLEIIRNNEETKMVPVVILTSSREDSDLESAYRLGASAYVVKPLGFKEYGLAVSETASFWANLNEPPPGTETKSN